MKRSIVAPVAGDMFTPPMLAMSALRREARNK